MAEKLLDVLNGDGFATPSPQPMFPNPPGLLRVEPHSAGLRDRIWWGSASNATSQWAAKLGMNLQSSTLKEDESGEPLHVQQRRQIEAYRRLLRHLDNYRHIPVLPFDEQAAAEYERLRRSRIRIGTMDLKIAAIALSLDATLLSRNLVDFAKVPGLKVEDWTA